MKKQDIVPDLDKRKMAQTPTPKGFALKANKGAAVSDIEAVGKSIETLQAWREREGIDPACQIRLVKLVHLFPAARILH
ncbi:hypothetical protein BDW71DRAFT_207924 [Aspergillus fruticulosus]